MSIGDIESNGDGLSVTVSDGESVVTAASKDQEPSELMVSPSMGVAVALSA